MVSEGSGSGGTPETPGAEAGETVQPCGWQPLLSLS